MAKFKSKYKVGQDVIVAEAYKGWVESVIFSDRPEPEYGVVYWHGTKFRDTVTEREIQGLQ